MKLRLLGVALAAVCMVGCSLDSSNETAENKTTGAATQDDMIDGDVADKETNTSKTDATEDSKLPALTGSSKTTFIGKTDYENATQWTSIIQAGLDDPSCYLSVTVDYSEVPGFKPIETTDSYISMYFAQYRNEETSVYSSIKKDYSSSDRSNSLTLRNEAWGWHKDESGDTELDFFVELDINKIYTDRAAENFIEYYVKDNEYSDDVIAKSWEYKGYHIYPKYREKDGKWRFDIMMPYTEYRVYVEMSISIECTELKQDVINKVLDDIEIEAVTSKDSLDKNKYYVEDYLVNELNKAFDLSIKDPVNIAQYGSNLHYFISNGKEHHLVEFDVDSRDNKKLMEDAQYKYNDYYVEIDTEEGNYHRLYKVLYDNDMGTKIGFIRIDNQAYAGNRPELTKEDLMENFLK